MVLPHFLPFCQKLGGNDNRIKIAGIVAEIGIAQCPNRLILYTKR